MGRNRKLFGASRTVGMGSIPGAEDPGGPGFAHEATSAAWAFPSKCDDVKGIPLPFATRGDLPLRTPMPGPPAGPKSETAIRQHGSVNASAPRGDCQGGMAEKHATPRGAPQRDSPKPPSAPADNSPLAHKSRAPQPR